MTRPSLATLALLALIGPASPIPALAQDRPDLAVADFEGETWSPWVAEGAAFGAAPARGAWPGQMAVEGFEGRGLVNSFRGGDDSTGTLTSPPFRIERPFLAFLIGGGKFPGETCLDLLVDGRVVRTATGPNDRPGGTERLEWASWDVADLAGRPAVLRVVDLRKGGWGHVNLDQVVQSDRPRGMVARARSLEVSARDLMLPVDPKAPVRRVAVSVDGRVVRDFDIRLAEGPPAFTVPLDLAPFAGRRIEIGATLPIGSKSLEGVTQANRAVEAGSLAREPGRPQFHFTSRRGWLNDPNGLVFFEGEYHLFYQHNPYGWDWGNMHWGHATSPDLVRWAERPIALYPLKYGDWAFSGSAVVDRENTSGFGQAGQPPLVAAYTSTGRGECIIFSLDRGMTWTEFAGNPVVKHAGRDPRLLWHTPTRRWVMAVYDETEGRRDITFHSSADLKQWRYESTIGGFFECPDLFELPVRGEPGRSLWVLSAADGAALLGRFDGKTFAPEPGGKHKTWHGHFYAAQTFSDEPRGRRVQVGWAQGIEFPGRPFNQQMAIPCELSLRPTPDGLRVFANPVAEVDSLRVGEDRSMTFGPATGPGEESSLDAPSDLLDIRAEVEVGQGGQFTLGVPGGSIRYDAAKRELTCNDVSAPLDPADGKITLRVLTDRGSIEVFGNDGRVALSASVGTRLADRRLTFRSSGEGARVKGLRVSEIGSSWR